MINCINTHVCVRKTVSREVIILEPALSFVDVLFIEQFFGRIPKECRCLIEHSSQFGFDLLLDVLWRYLLRARNQILQHLLLLNRDASHFVQFHQLLLGLFDRKLVLDLFVEIKHVDDGRESLHLLVDRQLGIGEEGVDPVLESVGVAVVVIFLEVTHALSPLHQRLALFGVLVNVLENEFDDLVVLDALTDITEVNQLRISVHVRLLVLELQHLDAVE